MSMLTILFQPLLKSLALTAVELDPAVVDVARNVRIIDIWTSLEMSQPVLFFLPFFSFVPFFSFISGCRSLSILDIHLTAVDKASI